MDEKKLPELTEEDLKKLLEGAPAPPPHWFERPLTPETGEPGLKPVAAPNDAPITEILDDLATASQWALWEGQFVPKEAIVAPIPEEPEPIGATVAPIPEPDSSWQQSDPKQLPYVGVKGFSQVPNWYMDQVLPLADSSVWLVLSYFCRLASRKDGSFKVSQRRIVERTGLGLRTVQLAVDLLTQSTIVTVDEAHRGRRVTRYRLTSVESVNQRLMLKALSLRLTT